MTLVHPWTNPDQINVGNCTSGFTVYSSGTGQYYGTTAGHCGPTDSSVRVGLAPMVSFLGINAYYEDATVYSDSARYYIPSSAQSYIVHRGPHLHTKVDYVYPFDTLRSIPNIDLCASGRAAPLERCGQLNGWSQYASVGGGTSGAPPRTVADSFCFLVAPIKGDSGAPVYHINSDNSQLTAAGLVSHASGVVGSCFQSADRMESRLNVQIVR